MLMNTMTLAGEHRDTSCSDDNAETVNMFHEYTLSLRGIPAWKSLTS